MRDTKFVIAVLVPCFGLLGVFVVFPLIYALGISLYDYNPARTYNEFVGLANYVAMLQSDTTWLVVRNTLIFAVAGVGLNIVITLGLAQLISQLKSTGLQTLFKTILFIPCVAPVIGTAVVWKYGLLENNGGVFNEVLKFFGASPVNWFNSPELLLGVIVVYTLWSDIGYNVILFSAGLNNVPETIEEAAMIDGAGAFRRFISIRIPLVKRVFAFVFIMTMADYMKIFATFRVLAPTGGVGNSAMVLTNYIYKLSFTDNVMGYGAAVSMLLFALIFTIMMIQNRMMRMDWSYE